MHPEWSGARDGSGKWCRHGNKMMDVILGPSPSAEMRPLLAREARHLREGGGARRRREGKRALHRPPSHSAGECTCHIISCMKPKSPIRSQLFVLFVVCFCPNSLVLFISDHVISHSVPMFDAARAIMSLCFKLPVCDGSRWPGILIAELACKHTAAGDVFPRMK